MDETSTGRVVKMGEPSALPNLIILTTPITRSLPFPPNDVESWLQPISKLLPIHLPIQKNANRIMPTNTIGYIVYPSLAIMQSPARLNYQPCLEKGILFSLVYKTQHDHYQEPLTNSHEPLPTTQSHGVASLATVFRLV